MTSSATDSCIYVVAPACCEHREAEHLEGSLCRVCGHIGAFVAPRLCGHSEETHGTVPLKESHGIVLMEWDLCSACGEFGKRAEHAFTGGDLSVS
jgi:hypothetical protein